MPHFPINIKEFHQDCQLLSSQGSQASQATFPGTAAA